jgi:hypothetical protein
VDVSHHLSLIQLTYEASILPLRSIQKAFVGDIYIRGQPISCIFDTGSTNTWIYHPNVGKLPPTDYSCSVLFGSGRLEGKFYFDDIVVGDVTIPNQAFGLVTHNSIFDDQFQCLVGLAYPKMKAGGDWHVPLFDSMMSLGITSFAFDLGH